MKGKGIQTEALKPSHTSQLGKTGKADRNSEFILHSQQNNANIYSEQLVKMPKIPNRRQHDSKTCISGKTEKQDVE